LPAPRVAREKGCLGELRGTEAVAARLKRFMEHWATWGRDCTPEKPDLSRTEIETCLDLGGDDRVRAELQKLLRGYQRPPHCLKVIGSGRAARWMPGKSTDSTEHRST